MSCSRIQHSDAVEARTCSLDLDASDLLTLVMLNSFRGTDSNKSTDFFLMMFKQDEV